MNTVSPNPQHWQRSIVMLSTTVIFTIVITLLYFARDIFIPLALAIFLSYVLAPLVNWVQRRGVGRTISVILVVGSSLFIFLGVGLIVGRQLGSLSNIVADNKDNLKQKLQAARTFVVGSGDSKWTRFAEEIESTVSPKKESSQLFTIAAEPAKSSWFNRLEGLATVAGQWLGLGAFAFILVVFILLAKEDLQDRIMSIFGSGRITSATRATGEANRRVSRYLLGQFVLNIAFGVVITIGLFALNVQLAILWGMIATLMRYVPYIGTWIGLILPVLFSLAVSDGWWQPLSILGLFVGLEVFCNNVIEPKLFSTSMGVSEVALLLSAAFWAFMWGPIGLIISGPITTCLLVLGKYHPQYSFLHVLLGREPSVSPGTALFQRLVAGNRDDARRVLTAATPSENPIQVYDDVVIPALSFLKRDRIDDQHDDDHEERALDVASEVLDELNQKLLPTADQSTMTGDRARILLCPAVDGIDELAIEAFSGILKIDRWEVQVTSSETLGSEFLDSVATFQPRVVMIGCIAPAPHAPLRYLCKRLRSKFPDLYVLVSWWGEEVDESFTESMKELGVSATALSFAAALNHLSGWRPIFIEKSSTSTPANGVTKPLDTIGTASALSPTFPVRETGAESES